MTQKAKTFSLNKEKIYHFGLDHLEVYASFLFPYLFEGMDFDNSNYAEFWEYSLVKHEVRQYECKYVFMRENIPFFAYYIGEDKWRGSVITKNYLCVYASAFRVLGPEKIDEFIYSYFVPEMGKFSPVRRFDICMDVLWDIWIILNAFHPIHQKWAVFMGDKGDIETRYIWEKCNTKNKRSLIRVYNKIKDILHKRKHTLYSDYLLQDSVTRIEIEVRRELAQNIELASLFDTSLILRVFKNYLEKHTDIFKSLEWENITLYRKREKIDYEAIQSRAYWDFRTKLLIAYAKSLMGVWICPTEILLSEWLIQERTKVGISYHDYLTYLKELSQKSSWIDRISPLVKKG